MLICQGVLCYMLLSGSPPFNGKTVESVYDATLTQDPSFPDRKFRCEWRDLECDTHR